jgi:hypothetical protein
MTRVIFDPGLPVRYCWQRRVVVGGDSVAADEAWHRVPPGYPSEPLADSDVTAGTKRLALGGSM